MYSQPPNINCNSLPGRTRDVSELTLDIGGLTVVVADTAGLRETNDLEKCIGVQRGVEASVVFHPHSRFYLRVYIISAENADVMLAVLPLLEVFVSLSSSSSPPQLDLQIPPSI